jgi:hypothetical protein
MPGTTNRDKYSAFAIAVMLATDSGLRGDFSSLDVIQRTPENLKKLIRHNLYFGESGVSNGQLNLREPDQLNSDIEDVVPQLNGHAIIDNWETLSLASSAIDRTVRGLLSYDDGGSCPGYAEQARIYKEFGDVGKSLDV